MNIVAVTSSRAGIEHGRTAAESLEQAAHETGHDITVEVRGATDAENELSAAEIAVADVVVIAADTSVSRDRFEGKPLVKGTVKDAVDDAEGLVERAVEEAGGADAAEDGDPATAGAGPNADDPAETTRRGADIEADGPDGGTETDLSSGTGGESGDAPAETKRRSAEMETERDDERSEGLLGKLKRLFT